MHGETSGTLVDPPGGSSCTVCGSDDCRQFHHGPYPADYAFLPDRAGYDRHAESTVIERDQSGRRKRGGLKCS